MLLLGLAIGCWQRIEYKRTSSDESAEQPKQVATESQVGSAATPPSDPLPPAASTEPDRYAAGATNNIASAPEVPDFEPAPTESATSQSADALASVEAVESPAVSAAVAIETPETVVSSHKAAWLLGGRLSLAALANDRGIVTEDIPRLLDEAKSMASQLSVTFADLPPRPESPQEQGASREVLVYLLNEGRQIGPSLAEKYGDDHAALFEIALKSNLLFVLNKPGSTAVNHISAAISAAGPRAKLPAELWQPLLDTLAKEATPGTVRARVRQMHTDVESYLSELAGPSSQ